jgi:hypothetical protein
MTNAEYIKSRMSDADLALIIIDGFGKRGTPFSRKIYHAWSKWAESTSNNNGNMAKGKHGNIVISENPSIWFAEKWAYPDGSWRRSGRTKSVSIQVWLSKQYDPAELG